MGIDRRPVVDRQHALRALRDHVQAGVGRDPVEPGAQRASPLEPRQAAPRAQQRVLERVLGVVDRAEHPVAVRVELAAMGLDEAGEGILVAAPGRLEQLSLLHGWIRGRGAHRQEIRPGVEGRSHRPSRLVRRTGAGLRERDPMRASFETSRPPGAAHRRPAARLRVLRPALRLAPGAHRRRPRHLLGARAGRRVRRRHRRVRYRAPALATVRRGRRDRRGHGAGAPTRRLGAAGAPRGTSRLAERRRRSRRRGDRLLAAEGAALTQRRQMR